MGYNLFDFRSVVRVDLVCEVPDAEKTCQTDLCADVRELCAVPHKQAGHCSECPLLEIMFNDVRSMLNTVQATVESQVQEKVSHFIPCHEDKYICHSVSLHTTPWLSPWWCSG
jgi:hypothetical protein